MKFLEGAERIDSFGTGLLTFCRRQINLLFCDHHPGGIKKGNLQVASNCFEVALSGLTDNWLRL